MNDWQNRMTSKSLFPFGSKSDPPLPLPKGNVVSAILECLLKGQELQDPQIDRRMESQAHPCRGQWRCSSPRENPD